MNTIARHKTGNCTNPECNCGGVNIPVVKIGRIYYCLNSRNKMKGKEQFDKQVKKQKQRNAIVKDGRQLRKEDSKLLDGKAAKRFEDLQQWFTTRRREMTGKCACGCNRVSSKDDNRFYKHSVAHLFPKAKFESVRTHPLNWVERAFWGGCHSVMDDTSMDRWVNYDDWEDIKNKFYELAPCLTDEERGLKFYSQLEKLVYSKT